MRLRYQWYAITRQQRAFLEYIALEEIERQNWYAVVYLRLWKSEGLICTQ